MTSTESLPRGPLIVILLATLVLIANDFAPGAVPFDPDLSAIVAVLAMGIAAALVAFGAQDVGRRLVRAAPRLAAGLTISLVTTAIMLVAAEFATRWLYRDVTTTADDRGYFAVRWARQAVRFNRHGFRDREFGPRPPGVFRIVAVGDSFTFGNGVAAGARYSALLEQALGNGFEVLNLGTPGFNTPEIAATLRSPVPSLQPDFVLVQWFVNDVEGAGRERPRYQPMLPVPELHDRLHESSALYSLIDTWWTRRQVLGLRSGSYADYMRRNFEDPQSPAALEDRRAWRAVAAAAGAANVPFGIVLFPDLAYDLGEAYPFAFLHDRLMAMCGEMQVRCVDLRPDFARVPRRDGLWASRLDAHPNARANAIAAGRIRQTFEPLWVNRAH